MAGSPVRDRVVEDRARASSYSGRQFRGKGCLPIYVYIYVFLYMRCGARKGVGSACRR